MAQWNQTDKTLQTKIVYWGAALCGKTTNLQQIHAITDPEGENRLISLNTSSDRTLFFDLLPLELGRIFGHALKIQLYTVPGQVRYDATRRVVLSGADAIVFVSDSQRGKGAENRAAWENLRMNMKVNGLDPESTPVIVQYNKQDIKGCLAPKNVESCLQSGREGIAASALNGAGVMETFQAAVLDMLRRLAAPSGRRRVDDLKALELQVATTFERYHALGQALGEDGQASDGGGASAQAGVIPAGSAGLGGGALPAGVSGSGRASANRQPSGPLGPSTPAPRARTSEAEEYGDRAQSARGKGTEPPAPGRRSAPTPGPDRPPSASPTTIRFNEDIPGEDLLVRSLKATLGIAEQFGEMREIKNRLARRIGELEGLQTLARELSRRRDAASILSGLAEAAMTIPGARAVSVLTREAEAAPLSSAFLLGLSSDPLLGDGGPDNPAEEISRKDDIVLLEALPITGGSVCAEAGVVATAIAAPLRLPARPAGLLAVYGEFAFAPEDARFLGLLAAHATVCLDNVAMTERLMRYNERLEKEVAARTVLLEKANEELRELDRMKDRFLSSVSHEMKTPLTAILSGTELLSSMVSEADPSREFLAMIDLEGRRLASLVDRIIRFNVVRRGPGVEKRTLVRPQDMVVRVVQDVEEKAALREVGIAVDVPQQLSVIEGNAEALTLALREIVENAIKFSPAGGIVQINAREELLRMAPQAAETSSAATGRPARPERRAGDEQTADQLFLVIEVHDRGPGIPLNDQVRIFEKFEQVGDLLTAKPDGLGLGLPIARELARRHGGDLSVHSDAGAGCEFRLCLPAARQPRRQGKSEAGVVGVKG